MRLHKKMMALTLVTLLGTGSMQVLANTPVPININAETITKDHWAASAFEKAKEYGIRIPNEKYISKAEASAHLYRTISLVDSLVEGDTMTEEDIKQALNVAKSMGLEYPEGTKIDTVLADINYETMYNVFKNIPGADKPITRLELADNLYKMLSQLEIVTTEIFFDYKDVEDHSQSLNFLGNTGIMKGADGFFRPNDSVTREELVVILVRVYELLKNVAFVN